MTVFDPYIFHILVFSPMAASIFITLVPTIDTGSKLTISRFFALISFAAFIRTFVIFLDHKILTENLLSFSLANLNINFSLILNKHNIFLYGAAAGTLLFSMFSHE